MKINDLGKTVSQRKWTRQATLCYYLGSNCSKCDIPRDITPRCQMRATILELVKELGVPPEKFIEMVKEELSGRIILSEDYIIED